MLFAGLARAAVARRASVITEGRGPVAADGAGTAPSLAFDEAVTADRAERPARRTGLAAEGASGVVSAEGAIGPADTVAVSVVVPSSAAASA